MSTLLQDTFVGGDGVTLAAHTPTPSAGFTWVQDTGALVILSNHADGSGSSAGAFTHFYASAGQADVVAQIDVLVPASGNFAGGLMLRGATVDDVWEMLIADDGSGPYIKIRERTLGALTSRATATISAVAGTTVTMTATVNGTLLNLVAGTGNISYSSPVHATSQYMGIFTYVDTGYTAPPLDNFLVTTIPPGGGLPIPVLMNTQRQFRNYKKTPGGLWTPDRNIVIAKQAA